MRQLQWCIWETVKLCSCHCTVVHVTTPNTRNLQNNTWKTQLCESIFDYEWPPCTNLHMYVRFSLCIVVTRLRSSAYRILWLSSRDSTPKCYKHPVVVIVVVVFSLFDLVQSPSPIGYHLQVPLFLIRPTETQIISYVCRWFQSFLIGNYRWLCLFLLGMIAWWDCIMTASQVCRFSLRK